MIFQPPPFEILDEDVPDFVNGYLEERPFPIPEEVPAKGTPQFMPYFAAHCMGTERNALRERVARGLKKIAAREAVLSVEAPEF